MPKQPSSPFALEGTIAHELGEIEAGHALGKTTKRQRTTKVKRWRDKYKVEPETEAEMAEHVSEYVALILEARERYPNSHVMLEQRVATGIPSSWGTSDVVIVSPEHVEIIDLKYGKGIAVEAAGNEQLRLYAVGALDMFGDLLGDTDTVYVTVHQPRLAARSTEVIGADELRAWRDSIKPQAVAALGPDGHFGPSESACRWCPAAGDCEARVRYMTAIDFGADADLVSDEDLGDLLGRTADIRRWTDDITATALRRAYTEGRSIPGWKPVMSGGSRYIPDSSTAIDVLTTAGYDLDAVADTKVKGVGALDKLVGKELPDILGDLLARRPKRPAMAPEDDKRPAATPATEAEEVFGNVDQG